MVNLHPIRGYPFFLVCYILYKLFLCLGCFFELYNFLYLIMCCLKVIQSLLLTLLPLLLFFWLFCLIQIYCLLHHFLVFVFLLLLILLMHIYILVQYMLFSFFMAFFVFLVILISYSICMIYLNF